MLIRSLRAFLAVPRVDAVCVAVRGAERERVLAQVVEYKLGPRVHLVEGGDHRQESVGNALAALECEDEDIVLVHDAVRPLIDPATIERTIDAVERHGAAIVGMPAVDTIKQVEKDGGWGDCDGDDSPGAGDARADSAGCAVRAAAEGVCGGGGGWLRRTDEASLLERAGVPVAVVVGSAKNFKITQPGDIELAEFYLGTTERV